MEAGLCTGRTERRERQAGLLSHVRSGIPLPYVRLLQGWTPDPGGRYGGVGLEPGRFVYERTSYAGMGTFAGPAEKATASYLRPRRQEPWMNWWSVPVNFRMM